MTEPCAERFGSKAEQSLGGGSERIIYNDGLAEHDDQRKKKGLRLVVRQHDEVQR